MARSLIGLSGMLLEISYDENIEDLKKFKKNDTVEVKILEIKTIRLDFQKERISALDWFKDNKKKVGGITKNT